MIRLDKIVIYTLPRHDSSSHKKIREVIINCMDNYRKLIKILSDQIGDDIDAEIIKDLLSLPINQKFKKTRGKK